MQRQIQLTLPSLNGPQTMRGHSCALAGSLSLPKLGLSLGIATLLVFLGSLSVQAQAYSLGAGIITGGGGVSTNGSYSIIGAVGQPAAGNKMNGGSFALEGGFWQAITLLQDASAPLLQISRNNTQATVFWNQSVTGFILEFTTDLTAPVNWQPVGGVANNSVNIAAVPGRVFFRLRLER